MKNKITLLFVISLILFVVIGCSFGGLGGSDKERSGSSTTKSGDSESTDLKPPVEPSGEIVKVGIPECDEIATFINDNSEEIEGSYLAKGIVLFYKNMIVGSIKDGVEKMSDEEKQKVGEACKKSLDQLKKQVEK